MNKTNNNKRQSTIDQGVLIYAKSDADRAVVRAIEEKLGTESVDKLPAALSRGFYLQIDENGLALVENQLILRGDFTKSLSRLTPNNLNSELLVRASKLKGMEPPFTAVDATAGLGEDALLLAAAGFHVHMYERNPVIAALLDDALRRGMDDTRLAPVISRMKLHMEDSIAVLPQLDTAPDIVVLDPMFPARQKSGLVKKKLQLLQQIEQPCSDEAVLLDAAISSGPRRIVIKRPLKGPYLADVKPSYSIKGKAIRYDCIALPHRS